MKNNPILGFGIGTGVAAGTAAALRAWTTQDKWADAIGAGAAVVLGGLAYYVKALKPNAMNIIAGGVISSAPRIIETLAASASTAGVGAIAVSRLRGLGAVQADPVRGLGARIDVYGGNANVGSHFGSVPLAGAH